MILFIFRLISFFLVLGLFGFVLFGPRASTSLNEDLQQLKRKHENLVVEMETDKNESDLILSGLYRARTDFRDNEEEFLSDIKSLESEINGFAPKLADFEKGIIAKTDELSSLDEKLLAVRKPIKEINEQKIPLNEKKISIDEKIIDLKKTLASVKGESDQVSNDLKALEIKRKAASESFEEELNRYMEGIKTPFHIYYTQDKDVVVANRAPSGKGIFINQGYNDGFREGMEFITKNENASSEVSFRLKSTLVQKTFSFLEFEESLQVKDSSFASPGQNLNLIRSGEFEEEPNQDLYGSSTQ